MIIKTQNDRYLDDDSNTTITKNSDKKESIASIFNSRSGQSIAECRQKQQNNQNKLQKHREPNKSFYQYMKKDQNLPNKNIIVRIAQENHSQIPILPLDHNHLSDITTAENLQPKEIHELSSLLLHVAYYYRSLSSGLKC